MDAEIFTKISTILVNVKDPVIFDLGACDAVDTLQICEALRFPPKLCIAFEPDPRNVGRCLQRITRQALFENVFFVNAAVGNVTGEVDLHLCAPDKRDWLASSSISRFKDQTKFFPWCTEVGIARVQCWRLDDFCRSNGITHIDLIWMDVQGAERLMIEGAKEILKNTDYIFTEFDGVEIDGTCYEHSSSLTTILRLLPGWSVVQEFQNDVLLKRCGAPA